MPTTTCEIVRMKEIIEEYVPAESSHELFKRLYEEVGQPSMNMSVKLSLKMLYFIFDLESPLTWQEKLAKLEETFESYYNLPWWNPRKWIIKLIC